MPDIAQLSVKITGDEKGAKDALNSVDKQVKEAGGSGGNGWRSILSNALSFAGGLGIVDVAKEGFSILKDQIGQFVSAGMDANRMDAILAQGLRSTHDASGQTTASLDALSESLMSQTGITDDAVKGGEQMLLTFTGIGKDVFPAATQAVADMATRLNSGAIPSAQQMSQVALQLGKALNDPATGLTALRREGVTFTTQQQEQIKAMVKAGNTAGAQSIMLKELQKEFGGSAAAAGQANGGMAIFAATLDDLREKVGQAIIPILDELLQNIVAPLASAFASVLPRALGVLQGAISAVTPILSAIINGGKTLAQIFLSAIKPGLDAVGNAFSKLHGPGGSTAGILQQIAGAVHAAAPIVKELAQHFSDFLSGVIVPLIPKLQTLAGWIAGVVKQDVLANLRVLGTVFGAIKDAVLRLLPHLQSLWVVVQHNILPALQFLIPIVLQIAQFIGQVLAKAFQFLMPIVGFLAGLLLDALGVAITVVGAIVRAVAPVIAKLADWLGTHLAPIVKNVSQTVAQLGDWFNTKLLPVLRKVWAFFQANILPILQAVGHILLDVVIFQLKALWAIFSNLILPILGKIAGFLANQIGTAFSTFGKGIQLVTGFIGKLFDGLGKLIDGLGRLKDAAGHALSGLKNIPGIGGLLPHFASGGFTPGGPFIGAEDGPELLVKPGVYAAPAGSQIYSASQTAAYLAGGAMQIGGGGSGGVGSAQPITQTIVVQLDSRTIAQGVAKALPSVVRLTTGARSF